VNWLKRNYLSGICGDADFAQHIAAESEHEHGQHFLTTPVSAVSSWMNASRLPSLFCSDRSIAKLAE
jgi:hypothetical protein